MSSIKSNTQDKTAIAVKNHYKPTALKNLNWCSTIAGNHSTTNRYVKIPIESYQELMRIIESCGMAAQRIGTDIESIGDASALQIVQDMLFLQRNLLPQEEMCFLDDLVFGELADTESEFYKIG